MKKCQDNRLNEHIYGSPTKEEKSIFKIASTMYCATDLKPFASFKGEGMINLLQTSINLQHGREKKIDVHKLVSDPTTVSRHANKIEIEIRDEIRKFINVYKGARLCFTLDIWKDNTSDVSKKYVTS